MRAFGRASLTDRVDGVGRVRHQFVEQVAPVVRAGHEPDVGEHVGVILHRFVDVVQVGYFALVAQLMEK